MTFLTPGFLYASIAAAAAIVALHFIVVRQPRSSILPTARFVPDTPATTVASARKPSDLLLLLLRVLTLVAAGAALAKPVVQPSRQARASVVLVDVSRSVTDSIALRDSARRVYRDGDGVVLFDSAARVIGANSVDSLNASRPSDKRGNLSAALVAAFDAGRTIREHADSVGLVIVSAFADEEFDAATDSIRALWPGSARLVQVRNPAPGVVASARIQTNAGTTDPLAITTTLVGSHAPKDVFIDRTRSGSWTAPAIQIDWPETARPPGAIARSTVDTVGGVIAGGATVIAPFARRWYYPPDSLRGAEVIARWVDGEPAAVERETGSSSQEAGTVRGERCSRSVAIPVTPIGDLVIRKDFINLVVALARPCANELALTPADPTRVAKLVGSGGLAPRTAFRSRADVQSPFTTWLLALALVTAIAEIFLRRRGQRTADRATLPETPARAA